jgi:hypothetical protein
MKAAGKARAARAVQSIRRGTLVKPSALIVVLRTWQAVSLGRVSAVRLLPLLRRVMSMGSVPFENARGLAASRADEIERP